MLNKPFYLITILITVLASSYSLAHFQLIYNPESLQQKSGKLQLIMPFTHPGSNGHVMAMAKPQQFFVVKKGKKTGLLESLQEISWASAENSNKAWQATVKQRGMGDYVYVLVPEPYYEQSEDIYIQQITKSIINVGGLPTDWDQPMGLPVEILPLQAPYSVYAGGSFSGIVLSNGEPVPGAEIEVELINYLPDMDNNAFVDQPQYPYPADSYQNISIRADANGKFSFGIPKAGVWGFAALGAGPVSEHKGKELSQDAVLWVQARELGQAR